MLNGFSARSPPRPRRRLLRVEQHPKGEQLPPDSTHLSRVSGLLSAQANSFLLLFFYLHFGPHPLAMSTRKTFFFSSPQMNTKQSLMSAPTGSALFRYLPMSVSVITSLSLSSIFNVISSRFSPPFEACEWLLLLELATPDGTVSCTLL